MLPALFLGTTYAMAKSADDFAACLTFPISITPPLHADTIGDYFMDCSFRDAEVVGSIGEDFPETVT